MHTKLAPAVLKVLRILPKASSWLARSLVRSLAVTKSSIEAFDAKLKEHSGLPNNAVTTEEPLEPPDMPASSRHKVKRSQEQLLNTWFWSGLENDIAPDIEPDSDTLSQLVTSFLNMIGPSSMLSLIEYQEMLNQNITLEAAGSGETYILHWSWYNYYQVYWHMRSFPVGLPAQGPMDLPDRGPGVMTLRLRLLQLITPWANPTGVQYVSTTSRSRRRQGVRHVSTTSRPQQRQVADRTGLRYMGSFIMWGGDHFLVELDYKIVRKGDPNVPPELGRGRLGPFGCHPGQENYWLCR